MILSRSFFVRTFSFVKISVLASLSASLLAGCSSSLFGSTVTPESRATLVRISNNYLTNIVIGNEKQFSDMVNWSSLLGGGSGQITPEEFRRQWDGCLKQFSQFKTSPSDHPFLGLEVTDVSVDVNDAEVQLRKDAKYFKAGAANPKVSIKFIWEGTGWVVQNDSIFGKDKFCSKYAAAATAPPGGVKQ